MIVLRDFYYAGKLRRNARCFYPLVLRVYTGYMHFIRVLNLVSNMICNVTFKLFVSMSSANHLNVSYLSVSMYSVHASFFSVRGGIVNDFCFRLKDRD
jgi:hypothetical protein